MSGDWFKDRFRMGDAAREVARRRAEPVKKVSAFVGAILFGTDKDVEKAIHAVEEDVEGQVVRARERSGAIDTTGEPLDHEHDQGADAKAGAGVPLEHAARVVCIGCDRVQPIAQDRPRTAAEVRSALEARGWRQGRGGGWRCAPCAESPGADHV